MSNTEILQQWENHSFLNEDNFTLKPIYSGMYLDRESVDDVLRLFDIDRTELESNTDSKITESLRRIDNTMLQTSEIIRGFILNYVFEELDSDGLLLSGYHQTVDELCVKYGEVEEDFKLIRNLM